MFVLSKLLAWFLDPLVWILVVLLVFFLKAKKILKGKQKILFCLTVIVFYLFTTPLFSALLLKWELSPSDPNLQDARFDVIAVLGGSTGPSQKNGQLQTGESSERLYEALRLYRHGHAPLLLLSGGNGALFAGDISEADQMSKWYKDLGIESENLILESASRNTAENAKNILKEMGNRKFSKALIITSALHARRAQLHFEMADKASNYDISWYIVDSIDEPLSFPFFLLPSSKSLWRTTQVLRELAGWCVGSLYHLE